jgi:hypothetical protein
MYYLTLDIVLLDVSQMSNWTFQQVRNVVRPRLLVRDCFVLEAWRWGGGDSLGWHTLIQLLLFVCNVLYFLRARL